MWSVNIGACQLMWCIDPSREYLFFSVRKAKEIDIVFRPPQRMEGIKPFNEMLKRFFHMFQNQVNGFSKTEFRKVYSISLMNKMVYDGVILVPIPVPCF